MDIFQKYGSQIAIALVSAGLICLVLAFFIFPQITTANVWVEGASQPVTIVPATRIIANWLLAAGIRIFPGDSISYSGIEVQSSFEIPDGGEMQIFFQPGVPVFLLMDGKPMQFSSSAQTIGEALWDQGIKVKEGDELSVPANTALEQSTNVELRTGKLIRVVNGGVETEIYSAADTVEGLLIVAGFELQGMDFTRPAENEPVPYDGRVEVVRVSEENLVETSAIPYSSERIPDPEMAVGEQKILQTGQNGERITSVRVRYENGKEVARESETEWISKQPISQKTVYGTRVVIRTSPEGLNYWLTKQVRVLSYRDTGNPTASGIWPYYGVIAVSPEWYSILKGTSIYVPGYGVGTVLDVCPGCSGESWIDVFIPTEDYVPWNKNLTIYFLAPAPENFSGDLP
ncbi:MAG: DUF348 domain-containing protein [Chloroflexi bacterium]|nr:DUF348 domain-containing protein [Chloroflexota bacterium]